MSKHPIGQPWLTAIYRVPTKPSTLRVGVWKQAKELGGLAIQQSTYLFPDTPEVRLGLSQLMRQVEQGGGEARSSRSRLSTPRKKRSSLRTWIDFVTKSTPRSPKT